MHVLVYVRLNCGWYEINIDNKMGWKPQDWTQVAQKHLWWADVNTVMNILVEDFSFI